MPVKNNTRTLVQEFVKKPIDFRGANQQTIPVG